jgi:hypothetical protein
MTTARDCCTRHAFTDGQCVNYGCKDCPATIYIPADQRPIGRSILMQSRQRLYVVLAVLLPVFIFAASVGLARAERAHQIEARV